MLIGFQLRCMFSLYASFTVLGLKSTSRMDEVKRKYYELAKQYHPDVNSADKNAGAKFAEINKAYKYILENFDEEKSSSQSKEPQSYYKQNNYTTSSKFKNQKKQKTRLEQQDYQDFYDYDNFFKQSKKFRKPKAGEDIYINMTITLQQSILGVQKTFEYTKYQPCPSCIHKQFSACFTCGGKGQIYDRGNRQKVTCEYCSGKGFKNECLECLGASYILKDLRDKIYIEKGTKDKTILRLEKKGHSGFKAANGDLYVTVLVEENNKFKIDGNNVHMDYELDYFTAAVGGTVSVETVYGIKNVAIEPGTQSGSEIRLFNLGLKSPFSKRYGDQIIKIKIKIPQKLTEKQKELIQKLCEEES